MTRVYTIHNLYFYAVIIGVLSLLFIVFQPRLATINPAHYTQFQQQFLDELNTHQRLNPYTYWRFREFYSLGNFTFDPNVVEFGETQIIHDLPKTKNTLLHYSSPRLESADYLVKVRFLTIPEITYESLLGEEQLKYPQSEVIFNNDSTRLLKTSEGKYVLIFAKSLEEMKKVNGFFNYEGLENWLLRDTVWLNVTTFW